MLPKEHTAYGERHSHIARINRKRNRDFDPISGKIYAQTAIFVRSLLQSWRNLVLLVPLADLFRPHEPGSSPSRP
jgi:hypothetical protein